MKCFSLILSAGNRVKWPAGFVGRFLSVRTSAVHQSVVLWLSLSELLGLLLSPFSLACHETPVPFLRNRCFLTVLSNIFREFFHISEHSELLFSTFPWVHIICKMGWPVLTASSQGTCLFFNCIINAEGLHLIFLILLFRTIQQRQIQSKLHSFSQKFELLFKYD